jgi:hypothetical protein
VFAVSSDPCTGQQQYLTGRVENPSGYRQTPGSATLVNTVPLIDALSGEPAGSAQINLRLAATKQSTIRSRSMSTTATPDYITVVRSNGRFTVDVAVSGSLIVNGVEMIGSIYEAQLGTNTTGLRVATGLPGRGLVSAPRVAIPFKIMHKRTTASGNFAATRFTALERTTCPDGSAGEVAYVVSVVANAGSFADPGTGAGTFRYLDATVQRLDSCSTVGVQDFSGRLTDPLLYEQDGARSARLVGTVELTDRATGAPAGSLSVDLTFTALTDPVHSASFTVTRTPTETTSVRHTGDFATDVALAGSVLFNGLDLLALSTETPETELGSNLVSVWVVTRMIQQQSAGV